MTPWPWLTEKCFCNSFPLQRRESTDTRRICWNGKIRKLEKAFRPVFDLSCFSFLQKAFMKWVFDLYIKLLSSLSCVSTCFDWPPKPITECETGNYTSTLPFSIHFVLFCPSFFLDDMYLLVSLAMWESDLNVSAEFQIRWQIVVTELSTCLSTGWIPVFHIDLSRAESTVMFVHPRALCLRLVLRFSKTINNMRRLAESIIS